MASGTACSYNHIKKYLSESDRQEVVEIENTIHKLKEYLKKENDNDEKYILYDAICGYEHILKVKKHRYKRKVMRSRLLF